MIVMPRDYYYGTRNQLCPVCHKHLVTATDQPHYEPGMGYGVLTTFEPCTNQPADIGEPSK